LRSHGRAQRVRVYGLHVDLVLQLVHVRDERVDLLLQVSDVRRHLLELATRPSQCDIPSIVSQDYVLGLLEVVAAVGRIVAVELEVPASLAWRLPVAFDLPTLALVATTLVSSCNFNAARGKLATYHAMEM
jgi:hypothetical protein